MLNNTKVSLLRTMINLRHLPACCYILNVLKLSLFTTICVCYFLFLMLVVLLSKAAWTSRPLLVAAAVLAGGVSATTSSSSRFRRPLPEAGVNFGRRLL